MTMGANYSFELISIKTYAPQIIGHNKVVLDNVELDTQKVLSRYEHLRVMERQI